MKILDLLDITQLTLILNLSVALVLNLTTRKAQNYLIAYFVAIVLFVLIADAFYPEIKNYEGIDFIKPLFTHLLYGPLLYLYISCVFEGILKWRKVLLHTLPFILIAFIYFVTVRPNLGQNLILGKITYGIIGNLSIIIYFLLGRRLIKHEKASGRFNINDRYIKFYYGFNYYLLLSALISIITDLSFVSINSVKLVSEAIVSVYYSYFLYPIWIIFCLSLLFYSITEVVWLKQFFVTNNRSKKRVDPTKEILKRINHDLLNNKSYLSSSLKILDYAKHLGITTDDIKGYLTQQGFHSFVELLNYYRIQEFKKRIVDENYKNYTLQGIAQDCGINSKTSLYRLFHRYEGTTPKEYLDIQTKNHYTH
ncbi:helix-turn-helix domain-containing protein [Polaribacter batillariae]|uniref:Helix-turn-helix domain-containing protein n=1 Tax=Polaribacter batillariae TaxID=2808900 RepID=A0ABX7SW12_9FLAO|nr:helix-turn-helix domain-containing protein [Polaribacter batillariae]QTD38082.1 helix-turn-helix domain-containing protein [Polaribacter batillariae]